jgi:hypothetical protein
MDNSENREFELREREVRAKEREADLREREVRAKEVELARSWSKNPIVIALIGTAGAIAINIYVTIRNNDNQDKLLRSQIEGNITLEAIKTGNDKDNCRNLLFFVKLGFVRDEKKTIEAACKGKEDIGPPSLPAVMPRAQNPQRESIHETPEVPLSLLREDISGLIAEIKAKGEADATDWLKQQQGAKQEAYDQALKQGRTEAEAKAASAGSPTSNNYTLQHANELRQHGYVSYIPQINELLGFLDLSAASKNSDYLSAKQVVSVNCFTQQFHMASCTESLEQLSRTLR